jgi:hypothetical protein
MSRWRTLVRLWESTQVELKGRYSEQRLLELTKYTNETSWLRVFAVMAATPLPCLLVTVAIDVMPLADPSEGLTANSMFFLRTFYTHLVVTALLLLQFRDSVPVLPFPIKRVIWNTVVVSACVVGLFYGFGRAIGFPVPFGPLLVAPFWGILASVGVAIEWTKPLRETPHAGQMLINTSKLWFCELLLVFTYPPYFYMFTTLPQQGKAAFALLLPVIKLFMRNLVARTVTHLRDEMPEVVVFNCDVFNALFVSYCMQNAPSMWITLEMMAFDIVMMAFALRGAGRARRSLKALEQRIGEQRSWRRLGGGGKSVSRLTSLDRARILLNRDVKRESRRVAPCPAAAKQRVNAPKKHTKAAKNPLGVASTTSLASILPFPSSQPAVPQPLGASVDPNVELFEAQQCRYSAQYSSMVRRLAYAAEFLLLLNYVEVIVPLVFCKSRGRTFPIVEGLTSLSTAIYMMVMYHLPNGQYYAQMQGMDRDQLVETLKSVQFYCSLQLASLLLLFLALRQILGLSPVHQLAFVLEKQFQGVQTKLIFWVFYNVQASLQHNGESVIGARLRYNTILTIS